MYNFLCGAIMFGCFTAGLFFFQFWKKSREPLFKTFAFAFWILAIERLIPIALGIDDQPRTFVYVIRLIAFLLIAVAIVRKNLERT